MMLIMMNIKNIMCSQGHFKILTYCCRRLLKKEIDEYATRKCDIPEKYREY